MKEKDNECKYRAIFSTDFRLIPVQDIEGRVDMEGNLIIDLLHAYKDDVKIVCGALSIKADSFIRILNALNAINKSPVNKIVN